MTTPGATTRENYSMSILSRRGFAAMRRPAPDFRGAVRGSSSSTRIEANRSAVGASPVGFLTEAAARLGGLAQAENNAAKA